MSKATIIFYRNGEFFASIPTFQKVVVANGLSKEEFTARLWREAEAGLRGSRTIASRSLTELIQLQR